MAYAGTPTGLAKQPATSTPNGLWQALLVAVVLVALVAGMVIVGTSLAAKSAVSPAVIPASSHNRDQIGAQRGAATMTLSTDADLNSILDNAHATPYVAGPALSTDDYLNNILDRAHATPFAVDAGTPLQSATSGTFHATPSIVSAAPIAPSATSGTFHAGWQPVPPVKRDRIGGQ